MGDAVGRRRVGGLVPRVRQVGVKRGAGAARRCEAGESAAGGAAAGRGLSLSAHPTMQGPKVLAAWG